MAANDLLYLIIQMPEGEPDEVAWHRLTPLVQAMENALGNAARALVTRRHMLAEPDREIPAAVARIAGTPVHGSLIIPFSFELLELVQAMNRPLSLSVPDRSSSFSSVLEDLANAATLLIFARDMIFGERGILASLTGQKTAVRPENAHERALETATPEFVLQLTNSTVTLMEAAERLGAASVHVRINDQSEIAITRTAPRRASYKLAAPYRGQSHAPTNGASIKREGAVVPVTVNGQARDAFVARNSFEPGSDGYVVFLWRPGVPAPPVGERVAVLGRMIDHTEVKLEGDLPDDWPTTASGIYLVERSKPDPEWEE